MDGKNEKQSVRSILILNKKSPKYGFSTGSLGNEWKELMPTMTYVTLTLDIAAFSAFVVFAGLWIARTSGPYEPFFAAAERIEFERRDK